MFDIIGLGKPIKDLLVAVDSMPKCDGATMAKAVSSQGGGNCASAIVAAARLGMKCGIYANIGDDAKGQFCRDDFLRHGVDVSHLRLEEQRTTSRKSTFRIIMQISPPRGTKRRCQYVILI